MSPNVQIVNQKGEMIGEEEKLAAHKKGLLHRAFSIFVFNSEGELMLQQRASDKYHSGGLWSNTCCSHPEPGEEVLEAAHRRIEEEMGFDCEMEEKFTFQYRVEFDNGLVENEYDHVVFGEYEGEPDPSEEEADDWKWESLDKIQEEVKEKPEKFSFWFKELLPKVVEERS